ncbi:MAG: hypothetical protein Tsb0019_22230 [Roseibium sp.]
MRHPDLWNRIRDCDPDHGDVEFPFSRRLARDNGWSHAFARKVVLEYQRFAYLSRLGAGMVTPSDEVDQAWHLHLTYTKHYWGPFRTALGAPLHHMPTRGGPDQAALFRKTYARTLDLYRQEFGEPPQDIWPPEDIRFGKAPHFRRVNAEDVWIIPKPAWGRSVLAPTSHLNRLSPRVRAGLLALLALAAGTGFALAHGEPAGDTLLEQVRSVFWHWVFVHDFWVPLLFIAVVAVVISRLRKGGGDKSSGCGGAGGGGSGCGSDSSGCGGCGGGD